MSGPGGSFGSAGLYVGTDGHARCSQYPDELPILSVDAGSTTVTMAMSTRLSPGLHVVAFARELAAEVARFMTECERLCAAEHTEETAGDGGQPLVGAAA